jgi:uncharacterized protein (TIGR01244 family)
MSLRAALLSLALVLTACASNPPKLTAPPALPNAALPAPDVATAGAVAPGDAEALARSGVRHVIDLRVDAETPGFDEAAEVRAAGLRYDNLPIRGPQDLTRANVDAFDALLRGADRPVLVHCGSSNRVGALAALRAAWIEGRTPEEALAEGRRWGLKGLEPAVRERLGL